MVKFLLFVVLGSFAFPAASDPTAEALARAAGKAQNSGLLVRAYMLYAEAAARDPNNESYRVNRDGLKPLADLLSKASIEKEPDRKELLAGIPDESEEPLPEVQPEEWAAIHQLAPMPKLRTVEGIFAFHTQGNARKLFTDVATAFGIKASFDPQFAPPANIHFDLDASNLRDTLRALTDATNTFVFPISEDELFIAADSAQKRDEYEPQIAVTVPLPNLVDEKATSEVANATRQAFDLRHIGMDSASRSIVIRDKASRALPARALLSTLIQPKTQVTVDVKILSVETSKDMQYGVSLPTSVPIINLGSLLQTAALVAIPSGFVNFLTFGGGRTLFGIGVTNARAIATYSKSAARSLYDATVVVAGGETAQLHVGDKYPIAQSIYTGASTLQNTLDVMAPTIQFVDLGILVKVKPVLYRDGDISMDIHAEYQAVGPIHLNTVPEILNRQFDGSVRLEAGQAAVLAGLDTQTSSESRTGIAGLAEIPAVGHLFSVVTKSSDNSSILLVITPRPVRNAPLTSEQMYYLGGQLGSKVLI